MSRFCLVTLGSEDRGGVRHYVNDSHLRMLEAAGLTALLVPGNASGAQLDRLIGLARAVYLPGSDWVPERLGEPADAAAAAAGLALDPLKVRGDLEILGRARDGGLPALGVCGGMQAMAILAGGALRTGSRPEVARHSGGARHPCRTEDGTLAARVLGGDLEVNSFHSQIVADPGRLKASARSGDGAIEAIEDPGGPFWLGLQWHPERDGDPRPFRALAGAAAA